MRRRAMTGVGAVGFFSLLSGVGLSGCDAVLGLGNLKPFPVDGGQDGAVSDGATTDGTVLDGGTDAPYGDAGSEDTGTCSGKGNPCLASSCENGSVGCAEDGGTVCVPTTSVSNGTSCSPDGGYVCYGGNCAACDQGGSCSTQPCWIDTNDCSSGMAVCTDAGPVPDGKQCGTNEWCNGGTCGACQVDAGCAPASNACDVGKVTACTNGSPTCTDQGTSQPSGSACTTSSGATGVCVSGTCEACTANAVCDTMNPCTTGTQSCGTTVQCVPKNAADGTGCGGDSICENGVCMTECDSTTCAGCCASATECIPYAMESSTSCGATGNACGPCASGLQCSSTGACGCPSNETACSSGCVDVAGNDALNCGACNHSCLGGTCSAGVCQPVAIYPANETNTSGLASDGTTIFWMEGGSGSSTLLSCADGGCGMAPTTLTGTIIGGNPIFAANALWWFGLAPDQKPPPTYTVDSCAASGCSSTGPTAQVGTKNVTGSISFTTDGTTMFWQGATSPDAGSQSAIMMCTPGLSNCAAPTECIAATTAKLIASAGRLYWTDTVSNAIMSCTENDAVCGLPNTLAKGLTAPSVIAVDGTNVYWGDSTGIKQCPLSGCGSSAPLVLGSGPQNPSSLVASGNYVYWVNGSSVVRAQIGASNSAATIAPSLSGATSITAGNEAIYFNVANGGVMMLAK
jgi:hypothetical protein